MMVNPFKAILLEHKGIHLHREIHSRNKKPDPWHMRQLVAWTCAVCTITSFGCIGDPTCPPGSSPIDGRCMYQLAPDDTGDATCGGLCDEVPNAGYDCETIAQQQEPLCDWGCIADFADCDGIASNGCEAEIGTEFHCGQCNNACDTNQMCLNESCVSLEKGWEVTLPTEHAEGTGVDAVSLSDGRVCVGSQYRSQITLNNKSYAPVGDADIIIACYDDDGEASYSFSISGAGEESAIRIQVDSENNLYFSGIYTDGVSFPGTPIDTPIGSGAFLLSTTSEGVLRWVRVFESTDSVAPLSLSVAYGHVIVGGYVQGDMSFALNDCDINNIADTKLERGFVLISDLDGNSCTGLAFNGSGRARVVDTTIASEGALFVTGDSEGKLSIGEKEYQNRGQGDAWLVRLTAKAEVQWINYWGSSIDELSDWIAVNPDGTLLWGGLVGPVISDAYTSSQTWERLHLREDGQLLNALPFVGSNLYSFGVSGLGRSRATPLPGFGNIVSVANDFSAGYKAQSYVLDAKGRQRLTFSVEGFESGQAISDANMVIAADCLFCGDIIIQEYKLE